MKSTLFISILVLFSAINALAQSTDFSDAEGYHRQDHYDAATTSAAKALKNHTTLKKNQVSRMQKFVEKDYPDGVKKSNKNIDYYKRKLASVNANTDSVFIVYTLILREYEEVVNMTTAVKEIPAEVAPEGLTLVDYKPLLESTRLERQKVMQDLADRSYKKGVLLKDSKNLPDRINAYIEFRRTNKLSADYNNVNAELTRMKLEFQSVYAAKVKENNLAKSYVDAEIDYFNFDSLFFELGNLASEKVKEKLGQNLVENYYGAIAPALDLADKKTNTIDNAYAALEFIDKIKKFDKAYKNIVELADKAQKATVLIDPRDNKVYPTMRVGKYIWMNKNLDWKIPGSLDYTSFAPNSPPPNVQNYGVFYQPSQAMEGSGSEKAKGVCPSGWHIPSVSEFLYYDRDYYKVREMYVTNVYRGITASELRNLSLGSWIIMNTSGVTYVTISNKYNQRNVLLTSTYPTYGTNLAMMMDITTGTKPTDVIRGGESGDYFPCRCVKDFKPGN